MAALGLKTEGLFCAGKDLGARRAVSAVLENLSPLRLNGPKAGEGCAYAPSRTWVLSVPAAGPWHRVLLRSVPFPQWVREHWPLATRCRAASAASGSAAVRFRCPRPAGELGAVLRRVLKWIHSEF